MAQTLKWVLGSGGTAGVLSLMTTELNSLANDAAAISSAMDNTSNLDMFADIEFAPAGHGTAPAANTTHDLYLVRSVDGTNYEDQSSTRPPAYGSVGSFVMDNTSGAQRHVIPGVLIPPGKWKTLLINKSGYALSASGNTLKAYLYNQQAV